MDSESLISRPWKKWGAKFSLEESEKSIVWKLRISFASQEEVGFWWIIILGMFPYFAPNKAVIWDDYYETIKAEIVLKHEITAIRFKYK